MSVRTLPRTVVNLSFQGLRLPLTVVERLTHNTDGSWPPAIAFEVFEAGTKQLLGALLRDDELVDQGSTHQMKAGQLAEAERLKLAATRTREVADAQLGERLETASQIEADLEREEQQREAQIEEEKAAGERAVTRETARRKQEAAAHARAREKSVTTQERRAERTRIAEESAALAERRKAVTANAKVEAIEEQLEQKKSS